MGGPCRVFLGQRYGRLVVLARDGRNVRCRCDCGAIVERSAGDLVRPVVASCGCYPRERMRARNLRHGAAVRGHVSREWQTWRSMWQRCTDPHHRSWPDYGGRGIKVCAEWLSFESFLADMGTRPDGLTLERVKNDLGYSKGNCIWATRSAQAKNRRPRTRRADGTFDAGVAS